MAITFSMGSHTIRHSGISLSWSLHTGGGTGGPIEQLMMNFDENLWRWVASILTLKRQLTAAEKGTVLMFDSKDVAHRGRGKRIFLNEKL